MLRRAAPPLALALAVVALAPIGCSKLLGFERGRPEGHCSTDTDCAPGRVCTYDVCRAKSDGGTSGAPMGGNGGEGGGASGTAGRGGVGGSVAGAGGAPGGISGNSSGGVGGINGSGGVSGAGIGGSGNAAGTTGGNGGVAGSTAGRGGTNGGLGGNGGTVAGTAGSGTAGSSGTAGGTAGSGGSAGTMDAGVDSASDGGAGPCGYPDAGECQPEVVLGNLAHPVSLTTNGRAIYWIDDLYVRSCAVANCSATIAVFANLREPPGGWSGGHVIAANDDRVYWFSRQPSYLLTCPTSGCPRNCPSCNVVPEMGPEIPPSGVPAQIAATATTVVLAGNNLGVLTCPSSNCLGLATLVAGESDYNVAADAANVYYADESAPGFGIQPGLYKCALAGCGSSPMRLVAQAGAVTQAGGILYFSTRQAGDLRIASCPTSGCAGTPDVLAYGQAGAGSIVADDTTVYWVDSGMVAAATGSILSCDLPLCAKGVRRIAGGQASPRSVIAAGNYIYWVNYGVMDVDGGIATSDAALMRVHK